MSSLAPTASEPSSSRRALTVLLSGVLLGLSYPPFPFAPLAWIALVPLLYTWRAHGSARSAFVDAYGAFLITFAVAFQWPLFHVYADTALLSLPGLLLVPMWMAVPFALAHAFRHRAGDAAALVGLACLFVVIEWGLRRGPLAFPWSLLGHTQSEFAALNGLARFGGVPLLTAFVALANVLTFAFLVGLRRLYVPLIALALAAGTAAISPFPDREARTELRVGIVQPAIAAEEWADLDDPRRIGILLGFSDTLLAASAGGRQAGVTDGASGGSSGGLDLIVWPETALPPGDEQLRRLLQRWVDANAVPLLAGAILAAPEGTYNAALLLQPGSVADVYRKRRLVPFAEHVPFQDRWPWVRRLAVPSGGVPGYARGPDAASMEIPGARFGVLICFETLFDDLARRYARGGADLIVAITQDGWWGRTFGYRQHLAFTRLRAIETGRTIIQVSVSGLSAVIRPDGAISGRIGWMQRQGAVVVVEAAEGRTPYAVVGDWVSPLALGLLLVLFAAAIRRI